MSNDSSNAAAAIEGRADPGIAFRHAMAAVETRCKQLGQAIERHDFEDAEHFAQSAGNSWLAGRVAYRRMLDRIGPDSPLAIAALQLLRANATALLLLMKQAAATIEVPSMQKTMEDIRQLVTGAMSEPLNPERRGNGGQGA